MSSYYDEYISGIRRGTDMSLLDRQQDDRSVYCKGACLAYLLNQEIEEKSNAAHSLYDVSKYVYNEFLENRTLFRYHRMLQSINTLIDVDIDEWWDHNEQFSLSGL